MVRCLFLAETGIHSAKDFMVTNLPSALNRPTGGVTAVEVSDIPDDSFHEENRLSRPINQKAGGTERGIQEIISERPR